MYIHTQTHTHIYIHKYTAHKKIKCLEAADELVGGVAVEVLEELRPRGDDGREHAEGGAAHLMVN